MAIFAVLLLFITCKFLSGTFVTLYNHTQYVNYCALFMMTNPSANDAERASNILRSFIRFETNMQPLVLLEILMETFLELVVILLD